MQMHLHLHVHRKVHMHQRRCRCTNISVPFRLTGAALPTQLTLQACLNRSKLQYVLQ